MRGPDDALECLATRIAENGDAFDDKRRDRGEPECITEPYMGFHHVRDIFAVRHFDEPPGIKAQLTRDREGARAIDDAVAGIELAMEIVKSCRIDLFSHGEFDPGCLDRRDR